MSEIDLKPSLNLRRETWQDSSGEVYLETTWHGRPGNDLENLVCVKVVGVSVEPYQITYSQTRLFHRQAQDYYDSLIRLAHRKE